MNFILYILVNAINLIFSNIGYFLSICVICLLFKFCKYLSYRRSFVGLPTVPWEIWLFREWITGRMPTGKSFSSYFFHHAIDVCKQFQNEGFFLLWGIKPFLCIFNEKYVKLFANEPAALDKSNLYDMLKEMTGEGLLTHNETKWRHRRKMFNPAFKFHVLKGHVSVLNQGAKAMVNKLKDLNDQPTDKLLGILKTSTLKILCESILGLKFTDEKCDSRLARYLELLSRLEAYTIYRIPRPWLYWKNLQQLFKVGREHKKVYAEFKNLTKTFVTEMKESYSSSLSKNVDENVEDGYHNAESFPQILLENHFSDPSFTMEDVQAEVSTFIFAGHDTTAYTMMWCLFLVGLYPEVQAKALEEIELVTENRDSYSYYDLSKMTYSECVIKETLRLYPAVPIYARRTSREIQCGEYTIPKNTHIGFITYMLHRNPDIYPDPETFCPERFSTASAQPPWAFVPFSEGIRSCIGKKFAMMEMKIILAHVLRNFKVTSLNTREEVIVDWQMVLTPVTPIRFQLTHRDSHAVPV